MVNLSGGQLNQQAAVDYQNAMAKYNNKSAGLGMIGNVLGGVGGFMIGGPAGAAIGSGLGGAASSLWGGSGGAVDLGTAFSLASALPGRNTASTSQWVNGVGPR
jgi:outer membrane lipoprotein SlyB